MLPTQTETPSTCSLRTFRTQVCVLVYRLPPIFKTTIATSHFCNYKVAQVANIVSPAYSLLIRHSLFEYFISSDLRTICEVLPSCV